MALGSGTLALLEIGSSLLMTNGDGARGNGEWPPVSPEPWGRRGEELHPGTRGEWGFWHHPQESGAAGIPWEAFGCETKEMWKLKQKIK